MSSEDKVVSVLEQREPSSPQSGKSPACPEGPESDDDEGQDEQKRSWVNSTTKGKGSIGLKTASGKKVSISKLALLKAKLLFSAIDGEEANDDVTLSKGWSKDKGKEALLKEEGEDNKENHVFLVPTAPITKKSTKSPLAPIRLLNSSNGGGGGGGGKKRFVPPFLVQATNNVIEIVASAKDKPIPPSFALNKAKSTQDESQKPPQGPIPPKCSAAKDTNDSALFDEEILACTNAFLGDNDEDDWF